MEPNAAEHETGTFGHDLLPSYEETSLPALIGSSLSSVNNNLSPTQEFEDKTGLLMVSSCSIAACAAWNLSSGAWRYSLPAVLRMRRSQPTA